MTPLDTLTQQVSYDESGYGVAVNPRRLGVLALLAALGVGVGFGAGSMLADDDPERFDDAAPVAAASPSVPSNPEVELLDDPDTRPLKPNLSTHMEKIGIKPFQVRVEVPDDWKLYVPAAGEWRWYAPGQPNNTYFLRVHLVGSRYQAVPTALAERIQALDSATDVLDFEVESKSIDTFVANYVSKGYRRIAMESFLNLDGDANNTADVWIALVGRERDRLGMSDFLSKSRSSAEFVD